MIRQLLICGLVAGVFGGLLATGFASVAGEPAVDAAIAFEEKTAAAAATAGGPSHSGAEAAPVTREAQKSFGLLTATLVYGLAVGGLFALVFGFAYGRVGRASPRTTAYWLAAAAFVVVFLVPFAKYPATPPAVGDPETIQERTLLWLTMLVISVLAAVFAARLRPALVRRVGGHGGTLLAIGGYLVVVVIAGLALPSVHEIPANFPATALWRFREASVGMHAVLWASIGLVFAYAAQRVMTGQPILPRRSRAPEAEAT